MKFKLYVIVFLDRKFTEKRCIEEGDPKVKSAEYTTLKSLRLEDAALLSGQ